MPHYLTAGKVLKVGSYHSIGEVWRQTDWWRFDGTQIQAAKKQSPNRGYDRRRPTDITLPAGVDTLTVWVRY